MRQDIRLSRLIHENMAVVMTFAFSHQPLTELVNQSFQGEWKYLCKFSFEIPEANATRAILELAVLLRLLDEDERITDYLKQMPSRPSFGEVFGEDESPSQLPLREFANKVIHSAKLRWDLSDSEKPKLVSYAPPGQQQMFKWKRAEINIVQLAAFCGALMS